MTHSALAILTAAPLMLCATILPSTATAQQPHPVQACNHALKAHKLDIEASGAINCNAGFINHVQGGQVTYRCPKTILITPAYKESIVRIGSGRRTNFVGTQRVQLIFNRCDTNYFLFIPYRDQCVIDKALVIGTKRDHTESICLRGVNQ